MWGTAGIPPPRNSNSLVFTKSNSGHFDGRTDRHTDGRTDRATSLLKRVFVRRWPGAAMNNLKPDKCARCLQGITAVHSYTVKIIYETQLLIVQRQVTCSGTETNNRILASPIVDARPTSTRMLEVSQLRQINHSWTYWIHASLTLSFLIRTQNQRSTRSMCLPGLLCFM